MYTSVWIYTIRHTQHIYIERDACIIECMCIWLCVVDMVAWQALDGIIKVFHTHVSLCVVHVGLLVLVTCWRTDQRYDQQPCMDVCMCVCMHICACMYVRIYGCMYVCMHVYVCMCV